MDQPNPGPDEASQHREPGGRHVRCTNEAVQVDIIGVDYENGVPVTQSRTVSTGGAQFRDTEDTAGLSRESCCHCSRGPTPPPNTPRHGENAGGIPTDVLLRYTTDTLDKWLRSEHESRDAQAQEDARGPRASGGRPSSFVQWVPGSPITIPMWLTDPLLSLAIGQQMVLNGLNKLSSGPTGDTTSPPVYEYDLENGMNPRLPRQRRTRVCPTTGTPLYVIPEADEEEDAEYSSLSYHVRRYTPPIRRIARPPARLQRATIPERTLARPPAEQYQSGFQAAMALLPGQIASAARTAYDTARNALEELGVVERQDAPMLANSGDGESSSDYDEEQEVEEQDPEDIHDYLEVVATRLDVGTVPLGDLLFMPSENQED